MEKIDLEKWANLPKEVTPENIHLFPKETQDFFNWYNENKDKTVFFPDQYYPCQKSVIQTDVREMWEKQPDLPLPQVIAQIMTDLPKFLPAENLIEVTRIITEAWASQAKKMAA